MGYCRAQGVKPYAQAHFCQDGCSRVIRVQCHLLVLRYSFSLNALSGQAVYR